MKRYWALIKGTLLDSAAFRGHYFFTLIGNILYITLIYFLWMAIYGNTSREINGMAFNDTFMYLTLATTIFSLMQTWVEWDMSGAMMNGNIVLQLLKPMNYQVYKIYENFGMVVSNFIILFLPSFILIVLVFHGGVSFGINILLFVVSILLAYIVNFSLDFMTGLLSFYTHSIWGISTTKEAITLFLSGAVIPLPFFPESMRRVVELLPFQAVYNIPLQILTNKRLRAGDYLAYIGVQILWAVALLVLGRLFFKKTSRIITVNGG